MSSMHAAVRANNSLTSMPLRPNRRNANGDRRAAPLTCYLAGQILAGEDDPEARVARIRALADELGE